METIIADAGPLVAYLNYAGRVSNSRVTNSPPSGNLFSLCG